MAGRIPREGVQVVTWEWTTHFEGIPSDNILRAALRQDMPTAMSRIETSGGIVRWLPLVSFNSQEGRKFRYLVMLHSSPPQKRTLPAQLWVYGLADRTLRAANPKFANPKFVNPKVPSNSGNYFLWLLQEDFLFILVFCGGRLCHWAEERCVSSGLQNRLEIFRRFLQEDNLFGREEFFEEISLNEFQEGGSNPQEKSFLFRKALKDPLWKGFDLYCERRSPENSSLKWMLALVVLLVMVGLVPKFWQWDSASLPPVLAPSLDEIPPVEEVVEHREVGLIPEKEMVPRSSKVCDSLRLAVGGIVAGKVFLDGLGNAYEVGDSVGMYKVMEIRPNVVVFQCGSFHVERGL